MGLFEWGLSVPQLYKSMQIWQHFCTIEFNGLYSGLTNRCKFGKRFYTIKFSGLYCIRLITHIFIWERGPEEFIHVVGNSLEFEKLGGRINGVLGEDKNKTTEIQQSK